MERERDEMLRLGDFRKEDFRSNFKEEQRSDNAPNG